MLDPWIIEKIRRREESQRDREAVQVEIPADRPGHRERPASTEENTERGVTIIDL
jgi:hypothetical protein